MPDRKFHVAVSETTRSIYEVEASSTTDALVKLGALMTAGSIDPIERTVQGRRAFRPMLASKAQVAEEAVVSTEPDGF